MGSVHFPETVERAVEMMDNVLKALCNTFTSGDIHLTLFAGMCTEH